MQQKISLFGRTKKIPFVCLVTRPKLINHILYIMKVKKKNVSNSEGKHEACNVL